jgi:hypothetical protein
MDHQRGATDLAREALGILSSVATSFLEEDLGAYLDGAGVLIVLTSRVGDIAYGERIAQVLLAAAMAAASLSLRS